MSIHQFSAKNIKGEEISLKEFEGKVLLIVNTASKCGLTPQFKELEELYQKHKNEGLVILGFPCNQFGNQEAGSNEEIAEFCEINYGVSFPIFEKIEVNGAEAHPLFKYLKKEKGGWLGSKIKWNFTKFLVDRNGKVVQRFAPAKKPLKIESYIQDLL